MPWISRDIKLCAQKVEPWINRGLLAVRGHGPGSLSDDLTGRTVGKNSGAAGVENGLALSTYQGSYTTDIGLRTCALEQAPSADQHPTWHYVKASRSRRVQCPIVGTELGTLPDIVKAQGSRDTSQ